jgi:hypothetical protein
LLEYLRARLRDLISSVEPGESEGDVTIALRDWQNIVDLQSLLARYVRQIGEPETDDGLDDDP